MRARPKYFKSVDKPSLGFALSAVNESNRRLLGCAEPARVQRNKISETVKGSRAFKVLTLIRFRADLENARKPEVGSLGLRPSTIFK